MKRRITLILVDLTIVMISFIFIAWLLPGTRNRIIPDYFKPFFLFLLLWYFASLFNRKYRIGKYDQLSIILWRLISSNFTILAILSIIMYLFRMYYYSRSLVFGVIAMATFLELILYYALKAIVTSVSVSHDNGIGKPLAQTRTNGKTVKNHIPFPASIINSFNDKKKILERILKIIRDEDGIEVHDLVYRYVMPVKSSVRIISVSARFNIYALEKEHYGCIVNMQRINDIQRINKFFEAVNSKLHPGDLFIGKAETYILRKSRIMAKYPWPLNYVLYVIDFILRRIWPKVPIINRVYFMLTRGHNRVISRAETLGRLYSCGFEVVEERFINNELYFVVRKVTEPLYPADPTYGPLIKLKRIGKQGKYFNVYKMRTMHPFAEYLQEYVYNNNNLQEGGKIKDDFRVTTIGRIMRKLWLDELPMFINVFKGELKIVGVRPLSNHYYSLYTEALQTRRIKHKPGLVPPFYADMPKTLEEIMDSEMKYLEEYEKGPVLTDIRYFFKAFNNILFKHARSN